MTNLCALSRVGFQGKMSNADSKTEVTRRGIRQYLDATGMSKDEYIKSCETKKKFGTALAVVSAAMAVIPTLRGNFKWLMMLIPAAYSAYGVHTCNQHIKETEKM